ncbi:glycosyltransferase family 2 protein [Paludibacterium purpuratum]|uniref:Glycosyl transferase family 2 n=1 Tax=Paludibacterium purpuratum TaxID=1144873 RepID=A0A4R7B266_9NEIS|nr:glycosyltransferase family 2 protein [Paludibacterium purpuratum]TDR77818.1 glycosyl transferase family 2 [Paludibacterium purpuratum]
MHLWQRPSESRIDVVVCTYRRPVLLAQLIEAIQAQRLSGLRVRLIVVDNDPDGSARQVVERASAQDAPVALCYVAEPRCNIALARNAGLNACNADFIALIDDDELPAVDWLSNLMAVAMRYAAGLVFAPVLPVFHPDAPRWLTEGGFFDRPRHATGTAVPLLEARTGNVLIRGSLLVASPLRFDPRLGLSGGEDYAFFRALYPSCQRAVWCDEAAVSESVPLARTNPRWLLKRSFRIGSVEASLARRGMTPHSPPMLVLKTIYLAAKLCLDLVRAPLWPRARRLKSWRQGAIAVGLAYGLLFGVYREYK